MRIVIGLLVAVILLLPVVLIGSGLWLLAQRQLGDRIEATVVSCDTDAGYRQYSQYCTARWTEDGVEKTGPIEASGDNEVGKTVIATEKDGVLYSRSLGLPLILIGLGLPFSFLTFKWLQSKLRRKGPAEVTPPTG